MAYDRRKKLLAAAKRQMNEAGVEFNATERKWSGSDDEYVEGVRSPSKTQRNKVNRMRRALNRNIRAEAAQSRVDRGTDSRGRDWTPMPEGTLVQFTKDEPSWKSNAKKGDFATVVKEFESRGKRYVEVLFGTSIHTISKGSIKEL